MNNNLLESRLYKLRVGEKKQHYLEPSDYAFEVPGRSYGNMEEQVDLFYRSYKKSIGSMGVLFTGSAGSGKSRMAEMLCNIALKDNLPVIVVTDMKPSIETIHYISMLTGVILFDEFGKNFDRMLQDKMLSMLSSVTSAKKLFIMTENEMGMVSPFILNRPGRVKYHLDFARMEEDVLIEYCSVHNISKEMFKEIYRVYEKANVFTFDHLSAMVDEINFTPNHSFEDIMKRLNLSLFDPKKYITVDRVLDKDNVEVPLKMQGDRMPEKVFSRGARVYVSGNLPVKENPNEVNENPEPPRGFLPPRGNQGEYVNFFITKDDIITVLTEPTDGYICKSGDYKVYLSIA